MTFSLILSLLAIKSLPQAKGQVDPSTSLLLRSSGKAPERRDLDSGRYTVRPSSSRPSSSSTESSGEPPAVSPSPPQPLVAPPPSPQAAADPLLEKEIPELQEVSELQLEEISRLRRLRDLVFGRSLEDMESYFESIHPQDPRLNLVELKLAPTFVYYHSGSQVWYRDFYSFGPGFNAELDFWLTPHFGVHFDYFTSLGHSLTASPSQSGKVRLRHQNGAMGIQFRRHFGLSRRAPSLQFGLFYRESQVKVPRVAFERPSLRSSGLDLSLQAMVPSSNYHAWIYSLSLMPRLSHRESPPSSALKSEDNYSLAVSLGSRYVFDRNQQFYWKLKHRFERNNFQGAALRPDPITSEVPQGVSVDQGLTLIEFGYTWGN